MSAYDEYEASHPNLQTEIVVNPKRIAADATVDARAKGVIYLSVLYKFPRRRVLVGVMHGVIYLADIVLTFPSPFVSGHICLFSRDDFGDGRPLLDANFHEKRGSDFGSPIFLDNMRLQYLVEFRVVP